MRVLVIEDDRELAEALGVGLRREQLAVDIAFDGQTGLEQALMTGYDVIVLDRDLPGLHGDDVCAGLVKAGCRSRVLMLTAAGTIEDRVDGLGTTCRSRSRLPSWWPGSGRCCAEPSPGCRR
jgi:DNA-binding response OmpR family regulator